MKKDQQYHAGKLRPFAQIIARMVQKDPKLADEPERLWAQLVIAVPKLGDKKNCPNCGGSMAEYVFEFDVLDALLLLDMAREVRKRLQQPGVDFTTANQVRVQGLNGSTYAVRSRTTQASKLGLVAKLKGKGGKHVAGTWVITARGWEALRGVPIPRYVRVWHGEILERTDEQITISDALRSHARKIDDLKARNKATKADYREAFSDYEPNEWVHVAGNHDGQLL